MRSKTDILLVITFTILILAVTSITQTGISRITGFSAGNAEVCVGSIPSLEAIGNLSATTRIAFNYDVNHTIANDDPVLYADTANFFTINQITGEISFTPEDADVGNHTIIILVNNTACTDLEDMEELNFEIIQCNRAPILDTIGNQTVWEDELLTMTLNATDPDGDNVTYACNGTTYFTVNETTGLIEWTPTNDHVGLHWFDCNATDDYGAYDSEIFSITVRNTNDAPIFLGNVVNFTVSNGNPLYEDKAFYAEINATDPDGDTIEFLDNTSLFVIGSATGIIYFQPHEGQVGNHSVEIYAVDGTAMAVEYFTFEILEVNDAPILTSIGAQTAKANKLFSLDVNATDEEDGEDNLEGTGNLTFFDDTDLFEINSTTGIISFTPTEAQIENYTINISVVDNGIPDYGLGNATDSENISFTITEANRPPNITSYSPEDLTPEVTVGDCLQFSVTVEDPDGGTPTVKWYLDEIFTNETGTSYNYCPSSVSSHNITALATDGELEALQEWSVTVNAAPVTPGPAAPAGGGGLGGRYVCKEVWVCEDWSTCMIADTQIRTCKDINDCGTAVFKPPESRFCTFAPIETCFDGIRDQNEILIDCGGVCQPCPHCSDKICNQGEQCEICKEDPNSPRCPRDLEGNIMPDCGGPCPLCPKIEKPLILKPLKVKELAINIAKITLGATLLLLILSIIFIRIVRKISKKAVMTEKEMLEINIVKEINELIKDAEKAIDLKDVEKLKTICANIENKYNTLSSIKNKKKVYSQIKRLKYTIKLGF